MSAASLAILVPLFMAKPTSAAFRAADSGFHGSQVHFIGYSKGVLPFPVFVLLPQQMYAASLAYWCLFGNTGAVVHGKTHIRRFQGR